MLFRKRFDLLIVFVIGLFLVIGCNLSERFNKGTKESDKAQLLRKMIPKRPF